MGLGLGLGGRFCCGQATIKGLTLEQPKPDAPGVSAASGAMANRVSKGTPHLGLGLGLGEELGLGLGLGSGLGHGDAGVEGHAPPAREPRVELVVRGVATVHEDGAEAARARVEVLVRAPRGEVDAPLVQGEGHVAHLVRVRVRVRVKVVW